MKGMTRLLCLGAVCASMVERMPAMGAPAAATSATWNAFVSARAAQREPILPDVSCAGYQCGESAIPDVDYPVFDVTRFGAVPDDAQSDRQGIEAAIAAATKNGSGIVFFPPGLYRIHEQGDPNTPISIRSSRIVLRGSGADGGTVLYADQPLAPANPAQMWSTPPMIETGTPGAKSVTTEVIAPALRESRELVVKSTVGFKPGDRIVVKLLSVEAVPTFLAPYQAEPGWTTIGKEGVRVEERHEIREVRASTNTLVLREALHVSVDPKYPWKVQHVSTIEHVGIEDIWFRGNWRDKFVHYHSALHDSGFSALSLGHAAHSWIRRCRFTDWNMPLKVHNSYATTVMHVLTFQLHKFCLDWGRGGLVEAPAT